MPKPLHEPKKRPSLREEVMDLDRDLLHLLVRRFNLLQRMRGGRGHLLPGEEKELREAWQSEAQRLSQDPRLISQLFTLLGELQFFPKPTTTEGGSYGQRQAFNLAPSKKALSLTLTLPVSGEKVASFLTLAAFSGRELTLEHCLMHDGQYALVRALTDLGASITAEEDTLHLVCRAPVSSQDASLHVSNDPLLFGLLAGQYLVRPSRLRLTAEGDLKLINLNAIARFLPTLGARLAYVVPRSTSFPIRLECTGDLPRVILVPADLPASFVYGLALALPFAEDDVTLDLTAHPDAEEILSRVLPVLSMVNAETYDRDRYRLTVTPTNLTIPKKLNLPCESHSACFLLAMPLLAGGEITALGKWPSTRGDRECLKLLETLGLNLSEKTSTLSARGPRVPENDVPDIDLSRQLKGPYLPLFAALYAGFALQERKAKVSTDFVQAAGDFFSVLGLSRNEEGVLTLSGKGAPNVLWNAPSPTWAMALALAALARKGEGFKLGNPGVITGLWPKFWSVYNSLPGNQEKPKKDSAHQDAETPRRRRIISGKIASPPREEDLE